MSQRCEAVPGGIRRCDEMATGHYRARAASGQLRDFALCPAHLTAWAESDRAEAERQARLRARAAFVGRWRAEHPVEVWGKPWRCPLCGRYIQGTAGGLAVHPAVVAHHQKLHGDDWTAYAALADEGEVGA